MVRQQKPLDQLIINDEAILLTDSDIVNMTHGDANVLVYEDLQKYNTIDDAFEGKPALVLLFQNTRNSGHWVALYKIKPNTMYYYDSYAFPMDSEIAFSKYLISIGMKTHPTLTYLIQKSGYKLVQNKIRFQTLSDSSSTCGRWCVHRINHRYMSDKDYATLMLGNRHYNGDFWVSLLTLNLEDLQ